MVCNHLHQTQPIHIAATPNQTSPLDFPIYSHPNHVGPNNKTKLGNPVIHRTITRLTPNWVHRKRGLSLGTENALIEDTFFFQPASVITHRRCFSIPHLARLCLLCFVGFLHSVRYNLSMNPQGHCSSFFKKMKVVDQNLFLGIDWKLGKWSTFRSKYKDKLN